jgi:hypothetical protein
MHPIVGSVLQFIGGALARAAGTGLVVGVFFVLVGVTPWEFIADLVAEPPRWIASPAFRIGILILGLAIIWLSLVYNRWLIKQRAIDELADEISWAIDNLLNRQAGPTGRDATFVEEWDRDFKNWCANVGEKLNNRAFFTRADQLHFEYLGFVDAVSFYVGNQRMNHLLSMLRLKIQRLREIINWAQERRR